MVQAAPDTSVQLPDAVRRAAERATQLANEQKAAREASAANAQNVVERTRAQMTFADVRSPTPPTPPEPVSVNPNRMPPRQVPPVQVQAQPQASSPSQGQVYTEQQFRSMQGRWEREQQQTRALLKRLDEMQELVATMSTPQVNNNGQQFNPQPGQGDVRFGAPQARLVTDKERGEYGEELIDVMGRRAREAVDPEIAGLRNEIARLNTQLNGMNLARANEKRGDVYTELRKEVPDWDQINEDPEFLNWLNGFVPYTGQTRKTFLKNAMDRNQSDLVVDVFKGFKAELAASGPAQDGRSQPGNGAESSYGSAGNANLSYSGSNTATTPAVDLSQYAAPGRARPGQTQTPPDKPTVSRAEIKQLYDMKKLGKFAGREDEFRRYENIVFDAMRDGRITP